MGRTAAALVAASLCTFPHASYAALAAYSGLVTSLSPKVYLQLDETSGTDAADSGSNATSGTYGTISLGQASAGPVLGTSFFHNALDTTTTSPVLVNIGSGPNSPSTVGTGAFSVEFWFKSVALDDRQDLMNMNGGGSDFGIHLVTSDAGNPTTAVDRVRVFHTSGDVIVASAATNVSLNAWHHLVFTRDAGVATLYLDGGPVATGSDSQTVTSTTPLLALAQKTSGTLNRAFKGNVDEFAIYGSALTPAHVGAHYAAVVPEPASLSPLGLGAVTLLARRRRRAGQRPPQCGIIARGDHSVGSP